MPHTFDVSASCEHAIASIDDLNFNLAPGLAHRWSSQKSAEEETPTKNRNGKSQKNMKISSTLYYSMKHHAKVTVSFAYRQILTYRKVH